MPRTKKRAKRGTGSVGLRGRTWAIRYIEDGVRKYSGGYSTKDAAVQAAEVIKREVDSGRPGVTKPDKAAPLFREVANDFLGQRGANKVDDSNRWERDLKPLLDHRRLDTVDPALLTELAATLTKRTSGASAERALYLLSAFYRWAIRMAHAQANPVRAYMAGLHPRERKRLHTTHDSKSTPFLERKKDVATLFAALPEPVNVCYALSGLAGLRPGEAVALRWEDVDLKRGLVTVSRQVRHGKVGATKSGRPRVVPLVPSLAKLLSARKKDAGLVVPAMRGKEAHLGSKTIADALKEALKKSKLPALTFYEAGRHTFASQWVISGLDVYKLSEILGHSSVVTTQRYAHLGLVTPAAVLKAADIRLD